MWMQSWPKLTSLATRRGISGPMQGKAETQAKILGAKYQFAAQVRGERAATSRANKNRANRHALDIQKLEETHEKKSPWHMLNGMPSNSLWRKGFP